VELAGTYKPNNSPKIFLIYRVKKCIYNGRSSKRPDSGVSYSPCQRVTVIRQPMYAGLPPKGLLPIAQAPTGQNIRFFQHLSKLPIAYTPADRHQQQAIGQAENSQALRLCFPVLLRPWEWPCRLWLTGL